MTIKNVLWVTNLTLAVALSWYSVLALLVNGGSLQGARFDFSMFLLGLLLFSNAWGLYEK